MDQPGKVANPARGQLNRENNIPLSPCVPENLVSRDGFMAEYGSTGKGCQSCSWSAEQGKIFPCSRACLRIWSRETGSAVPSRVSLLISILRLNLDGGK